MNLNIQSSQYHENNHEIIDFNENNLENDDHEKNSLIKKHIDNLEICQICYYPLCFDQKWNCEICKQSIHEFCHNKLLFYKKNKCPFCNTICQNTTISLNNQSISNENQNENNRIVSIIILGHNFNRNSLRNYIITINFILTLSIAINFLFFILKIL